MSKKKEYEVVIGYTAVITVHVKAEDEDDAKDQAEQQFKLKEYNRWFTTKNNCELTDDRIKVAGVVNQEDSWNLLWNLDD